MSAFERGKNAQRKIHLWIEVFSFCFALKVPSLHSALPRSTQALLTYLPREHPNVSAQNSPLIFPKATDLRAEANSLSQNSDQASSIGLCSPAHRRALGLAGAASHHRGDMRLCALGLDTKRRSEVCCDGSGVLLSEIICCFKGLNSDNHSASLLLPMWFEEAVHVRQSQSLSKITAKALLATLCLLRLCSP